jgi:hypothetical protein
MFRAINEPLVDDLTRLIKEEKHKHFGPQQI